ncbi:MAG: hypothetical protein R3E09_01880 [Novosphingobium sp.]
MESRQLRIVTRITTIYDKREDRLRLSVLDDSGQRMVLWLTQRLASPVLRALVGEIENSVASQASPAARPAVQLMEQARADLERKPAPPIEPSKEDEEHLILHVGLRRGSRAIRLTFYWGEGDEERIALGIGRTRLRQWLRIFHHHYKRADWPLDLWPKWLADDAPSKILGKDHLH